MSRRRLRIGDFTLDVDLHTLSTDEQSKRIDPKDLSVLLHLIETAPDVVPTNELLDRSWQGVVVGDNALHQVIARLRSTFGDSARNSRYIETLPKSGYRLLADIQEVPEVAEVQGGGLAGVSFPNFDRLRLFGFAAFLILIATVVASFIPSPRSGDGVVALTITEYEYLGDDVDGSEFAKMLTHELTKSLSQIPGLVVSSRSSGSGGDEPSTDLEGYRVAGMISLQSSGFKIETNLSVSANAQSLWSNTSHIKSQAEPELLVDALRGIRSAIRVHSQVHHRYRESKYARGNSAPYRHYLKALEQWELRSIPAMRREAIENFSKAINLDEDFAEAWAAYSLALAYTTASDPIYLSAVDKRNRLQNALARALELDSRNPTALAAKARSLLEYDIDIGRAISSARLAVDLSADTAATNYALADALKLAGFDAEADQALERAIALDPLSDILPRIRVEMRGDYQFAKNELAKCKSYCGNSARTDMAFAMFRAARLSGHHERSRTSAAQANLLLRRELELDQHQPRSDWAQLKLGITSQSFVELLLSGEMANAADFAWIENHNYSVGEYQVAYLFARVGLVDQAFNVLETVFLDNPQRLYEVTEPAGFDVWTEEFRRDPRFHKFWSADGMPSLARQLSKNGKCGGLPLSENGGVPALLDPYQACGWDPATSLQATANLPSE